jgi:hypothetical protein
MARLWCHRCRRFRGRCFNRSRFGGRCFVDRFRQGHRGWLLIGRLWGRYVSWIWIGFGGSRRFGLRIGDRIWKWNRRNGCRRLFGGGRCGWGIARGFWDDGFCDRFSSSIPGGRFLSNWVGRSNIDRTAIAPQQFQIQILTRGEGKGENQRTPKREALWNR